MYSANLLPTYNCICIYYFCFGQVLVLCVAVQLMLYLHFICTYFIRANKMAMMMICPKHLFRIDCGRLFYIECCVHPDDSKFARMFILLT